MVLTENLTGIWQGSTEAVQRTVNPLVVGSNPTLAAKQTAPRRGFRVGIQAGFQVCFWLNVYLRLGEGRLLDEVSSSGRKSPVRFRSHSQRTWREWERAEGLREN